jgi:hypothetical protein
LAIFLKRKQPLILFGLLSAILAYISFTEKERLPFYILPLYGTIMYIIDFCIISSYLTENINKSTLNVLERTIWKLPYFGIIMYYVSIM